MKTILFLFAALLTFTACKHSKKVQEMKTEEATTAQTVYLGEVQANENGCNYTLKIIKVNAPKDALVLPFKIVYPINLDVKYTKPGLKINFTMTPSKMKNPEGCQADAVVSINVVNSSAQ